MNDIPVLASQLTGLISEPIVLANDGAEPTKELTTLIGKWTYKQVTNDEGC